MITRNRIVEEARSWLGTRWHHMGRVKGGGVDCIGLPIAVFRDLGVFDHKTDYYPRRTDGTQLVSELCEALVRVDAPRVKPGDVLLFEVNGDPQHVGILSSVDPPYMIHAYIQARKVVEHRMDDEWRSKLICGFRLPGVVDG